MPAALAESPDDFEPKLIAALEEELPDEALLWVSSSMPIRDVEAYFPQSDKRLRVLANRGANGIDGVVSSALGAALATGLPTWLLIGEHRPAARRSAACSRRAGPACRSRSSASTTAAARSSTSCRSPSTPTRCAYEQHVATPTVTDLESLAPGIRVLRTDRATNVALHRELVERVAERLG